MVVCRPLLHWKAPPAQFPPLLASFHRQGSIRGWKGHDARSGWPTKLLNRSPHAQYRYAFSAAQTSILTAVQRDNKSCRQSRAYGKQTPQARPHDDGEAVDGDNNDVRIPFRTLNLILAGVVVATQIPERLTAAIARTLSKISALHSPTDGFKYGGTANPTFQEWSAAIQSSFAAREDSHKIARLTLALAFMEQSSKQGRRMKATELDTVWVWIRDALTGPILEQGRSQASRSAQGFLAVPLCSLLKDGSIEQLYRLHVWLPDGQRGASAFSIHSHQCSAQSWILVGEGKDYAYEVETSTRPEHATHAKYALVWTDGKELNTVYKTHQTYSKIENTKNLVSVRLKASEIHTRNMSYFIPAAAFHRTEVSPGTLHATLFLFDSAGGFIKDAPVLGPKEADSWTQVRDSAGVTPKALVEIVDAVRAWERHMSLGRTSADCGVWQHASEAYNQALRLCDSPSSLPHPTRYEQQLLNELSNVVDSQDKHENSAMGYVVCNNDLPDEDLVLEGLRHRRACDVQHELHHRLRVARLRKHYQDVFHRKLRPALVTIDRTGLQRVRQAYAKVLDEDSAKSRAFDRLKYVPYIDFCSFGRFPRSSDGLTREFNDDGNYSTANYFIFLSYRWINPDPWARSPDNSEDTQYHRAVRAIEAFLKAHTTVDRHRLGIWIDYACINQDDLMPGIAALPMVLVQCDTLISLVDERYYDRAWCSLEVMMVEALKETYKVHQWYEHAESFPDSQDNSGLCGLREGFMDVRISLENKQLRFEKDRDLVLFLQRQIKLLC